MSADKPACAYCADARTVTTHVRNITAAGLDLGGGEHTVRPCPQCCDRSRPTTKEGEGNG